MTDRPDDDDIWAGLFDEEPAPQQPQSRPRAVMPAVHRVLLPGGEVIFVFGVLTQDDDLPVPMIGFHSHVICVLPQCSVVERYCGAHPGPMWHIVWSPPPGSDVGWLRQHDDWAV